jgi:hypothetical protein
LASAPRDVRSALDRAIRDVTVAATRVTRSRVDTMPLIRFLRLVGIAIGSTVAAWLIVSILANGVPPS